MIRFQQAFPHHRKKEIEYIPFVMFAGSHASFCSASIARGLQFILRKQRQDGSWYGSWAVCFCYAAWFAAEAITACGGTLENSPELRKVGIFWLSHM